MMSRATAQEKRKAMPMAKKKLSSIFTMSTATVPKKFLPNPTVTKKPSDILTMIKDFALKKFELIFWIKNLLPSTPTINRDGSQQKVFLLKVATKKQPNTVTTVTATVLRKKQLIRTTAKP